MGLALKRISVVVDEEIIKKLRKIQSKQLARSDKNVSFSKVVNEHLKKSLR
jgi:hypothetical protein